MYENIWHCVMTLPVAMLSIRSLHSATVLHSNSCYTVVASIFLGSTACKVLCGVASVRTLAILVKMTRPFNATYDVKSR